MQFPAGFTDVGNPKSEYRDPPYGDFFCCRKREVRRIHFLRRIRDSLNDLECIRPPQTKTGHMIAAVLNEDTPVMVLRHPLQPHAVTVTGISTIDDSETIFRKAQHGQVGTDSALLIQEVGIDSFSDRGGASDLGDAGVFHKCFGIIAADVIHGEM